MFYFYDLRGNKSVKKEDEIVVFRKNWGEDEENGKKKKKKVVGLLGQYIGGEPIIWG